MADLALTGTALDVSLEKFSIACFAKNTGVEKIAPHVRPLVQSPLPRIRSSFSFFLILEVIPHSVYIKSDAQLVG